MNPMSISPKRRMYRISVTNIPPAPETHCASFRRPVVIPEEPKKLQPPVCHESRPQKPPFPSFKRASRKLRMPRMLRISNSSRGGDAYAPLLRQHPRECRCFECSIVEIQTEAYLRVLDVDGDDKLLFSMHIYDYVRRAHGVTSCRFKLPPIAPATKLPVADTETVPLTRRSLLLTGIPTTLQARRSLMNRIRTGPLEFARFDPENGTLRLAFLAGVSATIFAERHLSTPARVRALVGAEHAAWEWLPPSALPRDILAAVHTLRASRSLDLVPPGRLPTDHPPGLDAFGPIQRLCHGRVHPPPTNAFVRTTEVHYYNIADAIRAHAVLPTTLRGWTILFHRDPCEPSPYKERLTLVHPINQEIPAPRKSATPKSPERAAAPSQKSTSTPTSPSPSTPPPERPQSKKDAPRRRKSRKPRATPTPTPTPAS
ncbi:hypothetical protein C8J57DRAFT_1708971 [Mycena rebaudengoi]|nr:hypothetical protein C8J57DRAFT_1708971 [Mycena rebaudengoi]